MKIFDSIKDSVVKQFDFGISVTDMMISLLCAAAMALFILMVYRLTFRGVLYSKNFTFSLLLLCLITAMIIRTISSNLALSLGMVGALSIVRFRTAVKDPVDTIFMFWAIAGGIMAGTGLYIVGLCGCFTIGFLYYLTGAFAKNNKTPYLLVLRFDPDKNQNIGRALKKLPRYRIKSRTLTRAGAELTAELALPDNGMALIDELLSVDGVLDASLISYGGEFNG